MACKRLMLLFKSKRFHSSNLSFFILFVPFLLTACFVNPPGTFILKNPNNSSSVLWMNGKELIKLTNDDVELIVNYDLSRQGTLIFDVLIQNNTDEILVISPESFYCNYINRLNENFTKKALNPETIIRNYDKQIERSHVQKSSKELDNSLFLLFDIAETFQKKTDEERKEFIKRSDEREQQYFNELNRIDNTLLTLANKRREIATEALRKTSLLPGQQISGKIYFSAYLDRKVKNLTLYLPVKNDTLQVIYEVEKV